MDGNNEYRDTLQDEQSDDGLGENIYYLQEKSWTETFTWRSLMLTRAAHCGRSSHHAGAVAMTSRVRPWREILIA
jgi:hypothetical protein